jgi:hypothetical protein
MPSDAPNATSDPGFFDGRFMVEIGKWNWGLQVGLSHPSMPRRQRFQGGLMYNRSIVVDGRIRAPLRCRDKLIQVWLSPFGRDVRFNASTDDVGRFYSDRIGARGPAFEADLQIPQDALPPALTCLGSVWKFIDIWTAKDRPEAVTAFSFSAEIHPNLIDWAGPELDPI